MGLQVLGAMVIMPTLLFCAPSDPQRAEFKTSTSGLGCINVLAQIASDEALYNSPLICLVQEALSVEFQIPQLPHCYLLGKNKEKGIKKREKKRIVL